MSATFTDNLAASTQTLALGSYRHDVAYTAALKSQAQSLGSYRHDIAYTGALKSAQSAFSSHGVGVDAIFDSLWTGVELLSAPVLFCPELAGGRAA